jgi:hypothetical protein
MPWSAGLFTRTDGTRTGTTVWQQAKAALVGILASSHDAHDQDLATGINACLLKDGSNAATGNLNAGTNKITALGTGTLGTDAVNLSQVEAGFQPLSSGLTDLAARAGVPTTVGMVVPFVGTTVPTGWLECAGQLVLRASYPGLWTYAQASGTIVSDADWTTNKAYGCFSTGNGTTTFRLPDIRQMYIVGWAHDRTGLADDGRSAGIYQDASNLAHTHTGTTGTESATHTHTVGGINSGSYAYQVSGGSVTIGTATTSVESATHTHNITTASSGGTRNVPQNISMMYCISYL